VTAAGEAASGLVIAVDGPAGAGKSSAARAAALRLGLRYLDTGAMYRAMTWWMLEHDVAVEDPAAVATAAGHPDVQCGTDPANPWTRVDGVDVAGHIRSRAVTGAVSAVSAVPAVRARLVALQHEAIGAGGIVVEGRDIGTVVAPDAAVKVFLTADASVRAQRRAGELVEPLSVAGEQAHLAARDAADSTRAASPLQAAADAVRIDTTRASLAEVVESIVALATEAAEAGAR
jgi:cytidylate kinase